MTEEDEAFNEIERQAKQRKESVRAAINKPAPTYFTDQHAISMTLRDYFAAKAMGGVIATTEALIKIDEPHLAMWSYKMADAMLKAREA
jgi:hypothetical protein